MSGAQLPAIFGSTAVRVPDAILAPGTALRGHDGRAAERTPGALIDAYQRCRPPAGVLVDVYG